MATILPLAKTQFIDGNGEPLAFGTVDFYVPNTFTRKDTWQDASQTSLNTNPVQLDADGRAIIYGSGQYRQIVKDSLGNTVWDQLTGDAASSSSATSQYWGGTATGTANALVITIASGPAAYSNDLSIDFLAQLANTSATTVNVNGIGIVAIQNNGVALVGGELQAGRLYRLVYTGAAFQLIAMSPDMTKRVDVASAGTVDLTTIRSNYVRITGTTTITNILMLDSQWVDVLFEGALTLTHGSQLILPGGSSILTAAGDTTRLRGEASNVTRALDYNRGSILASETYGLFQANGIQGFNNAITPNTQYDLYADAIALRNTGNGLVIRFNPGIITNDVLGASPGANARDQGASFSANSWVHFYWIWNGTTLATISSVSPPPTGPTLPTGYTHWAYAGAVRFNASSQLVKTYIRGSKAFYQARQQAFSIGGNSGPSSVSLSSLIPPNALCFELWAACSFTGSSRAQLDIGVISGVYLMTLISSSEAGVGVFSYDSDTAELPNVGQAIVVLVSSVSNSGNASGHVTAYQIPNGGE